MDLETRVKNLEDMVASLAATITNNKFYTDADISGVRKNISDVTPFTETKTAYYGETSITFYDAPEGNTSVFFDGYTGDYGVSRIENRLMIKFEPLEKDTEITIVIQ